MGRGRVSAAPYEGVNYQGEDYVEEIVDIFFSHLETVKLATALNIAYQKLDPDTYEDLQEYLKDCLLDGRRQLQENIADEKLGEQLVQANGVPMVD